MKTKTNVKAGLNPQPLPPFQRQWLRLQRRQSVQNGPI